MPLRLYNSATHAVEDFSPLHPPKVTMYNCGPTVYDRVHIGNIRAFVFADILRRTLEFAGYEVTQVMNITDVDDKTIRGSQAAQQTLTDFTRAHEERFIEDMAKMNVLPPTNRPRATEHIPEMIAMIEKLLTNGLAYTADDGVYFNVEKSKNYGALAGLEKRTEMRARVKNDEYDKEDARDFALWKFYSPEDGDVSWEAPFGKGRPGWHIECSAMSTKYLGETLDIHTGGVDLLFPHHTNEIAQSEGATGKTPFTRCWLHNAHILVDGKKMSKSLGNTYRLSDLEERGISPLAFRYWLLTAHYRTQVNFTWETIQGAQKAYDRLRKIISELPPGGTAAIDQGYFDEKDLDTPKMISALWINLEAKLPNLDYHSYIEKLDAVLGLKLLEYKPEAIAITPELRKLLEARKAARDAKNYAESDRLREEIKKLGYEVKDGPEGQTLSR